ncbi:MAG TPA: hypothetical protein PKX51_15440, partial [Cyclobacteriaceae bacterium]|nr:hypothetical protein [Cyclobacteriaceae bacterium]
MRDRQVISGVREKKLSRCARDFSFCALRPRDLASTASNEKRTDGFVSAFAFLICDPAGITCVIASLSEVKKQQARCAVFFFFLRNAKINLAFASKRKSPFGGLVAFSSDPAGIRTQDPYIKSVML